MSDNADGLRYGIDHAAGSDKGHTVVLSVEGALRDGDWYRVENGLLVKRMPFKEANIEQSAQLIYESWSDRPGYKPWVVGGNSLRQDEARTIAKAILNCECPCWASKEKENG